MPDDPNNDPLKSLVMTAMMQALDQKARDELIAKALAALITPRESHGYSSRKMPTPLEEAFDYAVTNVARQIVTEMMHGEEAQAKLRAVIAAGFERFIAINPDTLGQAMADALTNKLAEGNR